MKKILAILLSVCMLLALAACGSSSSDTASSDNANSAQYDKVELKLSCNGTDQGNDTRGAQKFKELIEEQSGGAITVQIYNNDQLASGNMSKGLELLLDGTVDIDIHSTSIIANLDSSLMVSTLPWIFSDYQAAEDAFFGTGGDYIASVLEGKGVTYLGALHNGFKLMTNNKVLIKSPEDLNGLKMRIPGGDFFAAFYSAYGASPQAMSWSEVFSALQQGTIDGQDNSISTCVSNNIQEVQKYFTISRHTYEAFTWMANTANFEKLSASTQELIRSCVEQACKETNQEIVSEEDELIQKCKDAGCEFYELTDADIESFRDVIADLIEEYKAKYGEEACKAFNVQ